MNEYDKAFEAMRPPTAPTQRETLMARVAAFEARAVAEGITSAELYARVQAEKPKPVTPTRKPDRVSPELASMPALDPVDIAKIQAAHAVLNYTAERVSPEQHFDGDTRMYYTPVAPKAPVPLELGCLVGDVGARGRKPIRSYATGLPELDRLLGGGISTRQLTTVMGPPGAGKTAWAVALSLQLQSTLSVLYVSTELESDELSARIAAAIIGCAWRDIVRGQVDPVRVQEVLTGLRIRIVGCDEIPRDGTGTDSIVHTAKLMAKLYGEPPLVIVDYLQDLARGTDEKNLRSKIGDIASKLRALSQELDCPLVAVSSVSRSYYSAKRQEDMRATNDPTVYLAALAAAKESGDVDYASAAVLFLDVEPAGPLPHRLAQVAVAKSRHGETGFAGARFYGASGRWQSDTGAVVALGDERRLEVRGARKHADDEAKVMTVVTRLKSKPVDPETGASKLVCKSTLKESCGIRATRANEAIDRLITAGRLKDTHEPIMVLGRHGVQNHSTRKVIDLGTTSLPSVPV